METTTREIGNMNDIRSNMIYSGDCLEVLRHMENETVDCIITSPPYKETDGFSYDLMQKVFGELYRLQVENTLFFLNFGHLAEDKMRPFNVVGMSLKEGFKLNDTIVWVKNHYKPIQGERRLNNLTEFIFVLYKGKMPKMNRLALGVPYKDKSNARRFADGRDLKCGGNVWYINYPTITSSDEKLHHDRFPIEFPERCIKLCGYDVRLVLDPFVGSGTTCLAAKNLGKDYIGIDTNKQCIDIASERLT